MGEKDDPLSDWSVEHEGFHVRRHMDREFMAGIQRIAKLEADAMKINHALYGVHGDNGMYRLVRQQALEMQEMREEQIPQLRKELGAKFDRLMYAVLGGTIAIIAALVGALMVPG